MISPPDRGARALASARDQLIVAALALAASGAGLLNDFVYDDVPLIRDNLRVHDFGHWREILARPYWPPPFIEQLYRPAAVLLSAVQYVIGGGSPFIFRLVSTVLYMACAIGVLRLASRVLPRSAALAAAALFAAHPVHVEAVALGVNQGELLVALIALVMTCRYLDARRGGRIALRDWTILAGLYAVAALIKENGFILPGLLLAAELALVGDRPVRTRLPEIWVGFSALAAVGVGLFLIRVTVLAPEVVWATPVTDLVGLSFIDRIRAMLQVVPTWLRLFLWPAHLQVDYVLDDVAWRAAAREVAGIFLLCAAAAMAYAFRWRAPLIAFGLAWCALALLPVANLIPTGVIVAERTLFLPSVGVVLIAGALGEQAVHRWPGAPIRRIAMGACLFLVTLGIVRSVSRHLVWNSGHIRVLGPQR